MPAPARAPRPRRVLGLDQHQRLAERRRLLLVAALELFGTQGYARTSIEALCQTAGVGTNSFYEVFSSKEDVLAQLYDDLTTQMRDAVTSAFIRHTDADDRVRPLVDAFVHCAVDDPRVAQIAFFESAGVSPTLERHRRDVRNQFSAGLQTIGASLREDARRPTPTHPDPTNRRRNAVAVVGAIIEMTVDWLYDPNPDPLDKLIDDIADHCHRVLGAIIEEADTPG